MDKIPFGDKSACSSLDKLRANSLMYLPLERVSSHLGNVSLYLCTAPSARRVLSGDHSNTCVQNSSPANEDPTLIKEFVKKYGSVNRGSG